MIGDFIKIGRLFTVVPIDNTVVSTFGPETAKDGEPLATNTEFDDPKVVPDGGNRFEEAVFFKFEVPTRGSYLIQAARKDGGYLTVAVHSGVDPKKPIFPSPFGGVPNLVVCLEPGPHAADLRTFDNVGGKQIAVGREVTIQIRPSGVCPPPAP